MSLNRDQIISNASNWLGLPYLWGGFERAGIDCSAFVSRAWGLATHYTTDTIQAVSHPINRADLQPGDALNLPTWADPRRTGHIRLFGGWADAAKQSFVSYESTDPLGSVRRVVAWDDRYMPIRYNQVETPATPTDPPGAPFAPGMPEPGRPAGPAPALPTTPLPTFVPPVALPAVPDVADEIIGAVNRLGTIVADLPKGPLDAVNQAYSALSWLGQTNIWLRMGLVLLGGIVLLLGLGLFGLSFVPKETAAAVTSAAAKA